MIVNNVNITVSAVSAAQYPQDGKAEIAFAGRSNVGKSSLINKMVNRKSLARVSSKPGKTNTINFYNVENLFYFVDFPGYGFAKVSKAEKQKWGKMIEEYLGSREQLRQVVLLVDSRQKPTDDDVTMMNWIRHYGYRAVVVATKIDKLSKSEREGKLEIVKNTLEITGDDVLIPFSAETGEGKEELWNFIESVLV